MTVETPGFENWTPVGLGRDIVAWLVVGMERVRDGESAPELCEQMDAVVMMLKAAKLVVLHLPPRPEP